MENSDKQINLGQKIIYQIYPRSFYDSNQDGIGDLRGIIQKIPYLKQLKIDMIWFNPFFVSPQNDNGYDIADYYQIDPQFGTMADFEELTAKLHENHIDVMLDMVFNHCSTSHPWFQKALAGDQFYQKFFYLRPPKKDGSLPTNWQSKFGGPAWAKFGDSGWYYLHLYDPTQADLDWHNPAVRQEAAKIVNFWRKKGVKGFRFDVFNVTGKDQQLVDSTDPLQEKKLYTDTPIVHQYLKELNQASFGQDTSIITVGEMSSTTIENSVKYTQPKNHELSMIFTFHHLKVDYRNGNKWDSMPFDFLKLKQLLFDWQVELDQHAGWNALFWNNHDQPRALSRFGDPQNYRIKSAQVLATVMQLMRGTPFIYQGEEIGMTDPDYQKISDYKDVESLNAYQELLAAGKTPAQALAAIKKKSRDNSRTPMQWNADQFAGFSKVKPWLKPTNQTQINVAAELATGQIFNYYQQLFQLRKTEPLIYQGHIRPLWIDHPQVMGYLRYLKQQCLLVITNFYGKSTQVILPPELQQQSCQVLLTNYQQNINKIPSSLKLQPYEAIVLKL
ncbi:alpha,alpha-phosphotrehalase [Liquorilactobacillus vini]|uniref:Alpha,alpha-phosphotrehalase n=1 Tax=Liquorilactobacillus vini DSM 20605 TaxID=1133569 RepID=A0A0R2CC67_9LACO|nr:alpha,alpha-phosphotrehalase [Liquorilactobacillus vini]KRM89320.1 alpha,alpha-phosphotrehalase [Liquorilactobacillus vini DSM 20605]